MAADNPTHVTVARILRPQGRKGEVASEILTDFPERLKTLKEVELWDGHSNRRRVGVRSCWISLSHGGQAIFHFEGSNSIGDAERLAGLQIQLPIGDRMALPAGRYYISDLIGCDVRENGDMVGPVRDVQFTGEETSGTPILIVDTPNGELLIPLAEDICIRIDTAEKEIEVVLPEGLRDLNREP